MKHRTNMAIFCIFKIFFLPSIIADEIKISENGSVHWIRNWKETREQSRNGVINQLVGVNTEMKYIVDSPLNATIGKLIKETKVDGCQREDCNIILRSGNGTVFYRKRINNSIDKIVIDLGTGQGHKNF